MSPPSKPEPAGVPEASNTGVPGFRSWKSVYLFVIATFVAWLALLTWLTKNYA